MTDYEKAHDRMVTVLKSLMWTISKSNEYGSTMISSSGAMAFISKQEGYFCITDNFALFALRDCVLLWDGTIDHKHSVSLTYGDGIMRRSEIINYRFVRDKFSHLRFLLKENP